MELAQLQRIGLPIVTHTFPHEPGAHAKGPAKSVEKPFAKTSLEAKELAAQPSGQVFLSRLPSGCLAEWQTWANQHPGKDDPVFVHNGVEAGALVGTPTTCSFISWNILSPVNLARAQEGSREGKYACAPEGSEFTTWGYPYVSREIGDWSVRRDKIIKWLLLLSPDVILLQEVDKDGFEDSFAVLAEAGYDCLTQKSGDKQPFGLVTFWLASRLRKKKDNRKGSATLITNLEFRDGPLQGVELVVVNAHLRAGEDQHETRAGQVDNCLCRAAKEGHGAAMILAGDFNSGPETSLAHVLRSHRWHGYGLASAYEHPAAAKTSPVTECTFAGDGARFFLDHFYYQHDRCRLTTVLQPLLEPARSVSLGLGRPGLPDANVPSDHIPIGMVLEIIPTLSC